MAPKKSTRTVSPAKKIRRKKDPNAPKQPMSAYFFYNTERRPELVKKNPELKPDVKAVAKIIGAEWQALEADKRKPYQAKADADKIRYEKEKAAYVKESDD